ncbi:hypothetical protein D9756_008941 [Leucocoprinus leucothites]|uniref:Dienelactone hydrolase domain-containing protein n=1 Tax=Leucocoprinus leucothites TaxID=201217 RepID=A0A8H5CXE2_9AGAR|nr:hypothetical protein D9756_008941 [Leucoagaricus leucothites]
MSSSKPIAGPHSDHCFKGVKHTGEPVGKTLEFGGLSTYVSEPKSGEAKGIILFFPDVFGPFFINNQLLQDYFAENGFLVLGVDYFFGDGIHKHPEADFDRKTWIEAARSRAAAETPAWIRAVQEHYGNDKKYTAIGYCFGATYALDMAGTDQVVAGKVDTSLSLYYQAQSYSTAGFAHPGPLTEDQFRNVKNPLLILAAETDHAFPPESRHRAEAILQEIGASYHLRLFSGVAHGFATRGDPEVEISRWAKEEAAATVTNFFARFI